MDAGKYHIVAICGSTRKKSTNESILRSIATMYEGSLDLELYLNIATLPHFNPDLDNEQVPSPVEHFRQLIDKADGVIICTPEYVFSLPGALKNALEWTVSTTVFMDKPVAMIVAATGGEKAFESLELILETMGARVTEDSKLLLQGARSKVGKNGDLPDESTATKMRTAIDSLRATITSSGVTS